MSLINLKIACPTIIFDIKYATPDNFMGEVLYQTDECYLHKDAARELAKVVAFLKPKELGLKIWDGYRPFSVQEKMWEKLPDERYVGPPAKGGRHTRGTAVDVTLIDLAKGKELLMPTPFDTFSEKAHHGFKDLLAEAIVNRELLKEALTMHANFEPLLTEWWHYDLKGWQSYAIV